jgi:hypothetical protein
MGHDDRAIAEFTGELGGLLSGLSPVLVYLDGSAGTALARAAEREGRSGSMSTSASSPGTACGLPSATSHRPSSISAASGPSLSRRRGGWAGP